MRVVDAAGRLRDEAGALSFGGKAAFTYRPLAYAWDVHRRFAERFGKGRKRLLFVGMNPGPWGMGQTGVPFGSARRVTGWMGLAGEVGQPPRAHPKRPVLGLACARSDPSGERFYSWAESRWGSADEFFRDAYVVNHVPLLFLDEAGRNVTPADLPRRGTAALLEACDAHLAEVLDALRPGRVVAVGKWAEAQVARVLREAGRDVDVLGVLHPSPASPLTNSGWDKHMDARLPR